MNELTPYWQAAAAVLVLTGLWRLIFQAHYRAWQRRRHAASLADRHARGGDAYFEELRALEAYPPDAASPPLARMIGALMVVSGVSILAFSFTR